VPAESRPEYKQRCKRCDKPKEGRMTHKELFPEGLPEYLNFITKTLDKQSPPWEWVSHLADTFIHIPKGDYYAEKELESMGINSVGVFIERDVQLAKHVSILGPTWIGKGTQIRPGCFIRENVIVGRNSVLGNSCEFKNCLLMDSCQVPHFSYVGDSILGNHSHLGAGAIISNLRLDKKPIKVKTATETIQTNMVKLGAVLGDYAEVGCNSVLNPGSILGTRALVSSGVSWSGYVAPNHLVKSTTAIVPRRD
jgi:UDP-3-O-[3-hydroxymyristoyl] glucosamine N-acyltransferase